jgi:hypothetical protein
MRAVMRVGSPAGVRAPCCSRWELVFEGVDDRFDPLPDPADRRLGSTLATSAGPTSLSPAWTLSHNACKRSVRNPRALNDPHHNRSTGDAIQYP